MTDAHGAPCFDLLRRGSWVKPDAILCAFDLIELNGQDLRRLPIETRKLYLERLVRRSGPDISYVDHVFGDGPAVFEKVCSLGLEGIVSKRKGSTYRSGVRWIGELQEPRQPGRAAGGGRGLGTMTAKNLALPVATPDAFPAFDKAGRRPVRKKHQQFHRSTAEQQNLTAASVSLTTRRHPSNRG